MERLDEAHHSDPLLVAYLAERQLWLTQLRWIAIGGILGVVTVAARSGLITQALQHLSIRAYLRLTQLPDIVQNALSIEWLSFIVTHQCSDGCGGKEIASP